MPDKGKALRLFNISWKPKTDPLQRALPCCKTWVLRSATTTGLVKRKAHWEGHLFWMPRIQKSITTSASFNIARNSIHRQETACSNHWNFFRHRKKLQILPVLPSITTPGRLRWAFTFTWGWFMKNWNNSNHHCNIFMLPTNWIQTTCKYRLTWPGSTILMLRAWLHREYCLWLRRSSRKPFTIYPGLKCQNRHFIKLQRFWKRNKRW